MIPESAYGPPATPRGVTDEKPRCDSCDRVIAWYVTRPWKIRCPRCKQDTVRDTINA